MKLWETFNQAEFALLCKDKDNYFAMAKDGENVYVSNGRIEIHKAAEEFFGGHLSCNQIVKEEWEPISREQLNNKLWKS